MKTPTQQLLDFDPTQPIPEAQPDPKPDQTQRLLDKLQEESAEVIQAVSKVRRFGKHNRHPDRETTNHTELIIELEDFLAIVAALEHIQYFDLAKHKHTIHKKMQGLISS